MARYRVLFGLWLAIWLVLWALGKNAMPLCVLLGSLVAAIAELACTALAAKHLRLSLSAPLSVQKGEEVSVCVQVENTGLFSLATLSVQVCCRNLLTDERSCRALRISAPGRQRQSEVVTFAGLRCGKLELTLPELRVYDLFGLYGRRVAENVRTFSLVLPKLYPVQLQTGERTIPDFDSDEYSMRHPGDDPSETFALREYVPGDRVRSIHWKLTEKTGDVIVRQLGLPVDHSILLLLDNSAPEACTPADKESLGELTASVSAALCAAGLTHHIAWYDRNQDAVSSVPVEGEDTLTPALAELLAARIVPDEHGFGAFCSVRRLLGLCPCGAFDPASGAGAHPRRGERTLVHRGTLRRGGKQRGGGLPCALSLLPSACVHICLRFCWRRR